MIVPSGKIRPQVNQGEMKNSSLFDGVKIAFTPGREMTQNPPDELQDAMNQGQDPGMSGMSNEPGNRMPGDQGAEMGGGKPPMPSADAVQPQGANRWLVPDGSQEEQVQDRAILTEVSKLEQAAGQGFEDSISMKRSKDGSFEAEVPAPEGYSIQQALQFANALMQAVDGELENFDPGKQSGVMRLTYKSKSLGQPRVEKAKSSRR